MTELTAAIPGPAEPSKSLLARVFGVFVSPRATYAAVAAHPRWFGVLAITCLVVSVGYFVLLSTEVGQQAVLDQQIQVLESFGVKLNDQAYERMEAGIENARYTTAGSQLVAFPVFILIMSGILIGVFNALLGGDATFKQVFAIVAHSSLITALQTVFALPLDYVRESLSSPTSLAVFAPFLEENSFMARLLGSIDLFQIWSTVSLAIGMGVLYKRRTTPIATSLFLIYFVVVLVVTAVRSALSS